MASRLNFPLVVGLTLASLLTPVTAVSAQRKPDPPPPAPRGTGDFDNLPESYDAFINAYRRAGQPKILIFTLLVTADEVPDARKILVDQAKADRFTSRLIGIFTTSPQIEIVNPVGATFAGQEQLSRLRRNDEFSAARMLGDEAGADIVIFVRMLDQPGLTYAATYVVLDLRRGRTMDQFSWDMSPDRGGTFSQRRMGDYARVVADRVMRRFDRAFPREQKPGLDAIGGGIRNFTIDIIGDLSGEGPIVLRDVLRSISGVTEGSVYFVKEEQVHLGRSMMIFKLTYKGDPLDLRHGLYLAAADRLGVQASILGAGEGSITMRLEPKRLSTRESLLSGGPITPENRKIRQELTLHYAEENKPRIAVMINQAAKRGTEPDQPDKYDDQETDTDAEKQPDLSSREEAPGPAGGGITVIVNPRIVVGGDLHEHVDEVHSGHSHAKPGATRRDKDDDSRSASDGSKLSEDALDTFMMENEVSGRLRDLGLIPVNLDQARQLLSKDMDLAGRVLGDWDLAELLSRKVDFDIMISGVGRVLRDDVPPVMRYTFRAFRMQDAEGLAFATVEREVQGSAGTGAVMRELAADAVGRLAFQLLNSWKPPKTLEVMVTNANTEREVYAIMDLLEEKFPDSIIRTTFLSRESGREGGLATFRIEYTTDYDQLKREILAADDLPFDLNSQSSTRNRLNIRITGRLTCSKF